jgi:hypothetical protein
MFINIDTSRVAAVKQKPGDVVFAKAALQITLLHAGTPQGLFCVARSRMADGVGFEPTVRLHARRFSRPVP